LLNVFVQEGDVLFDLPIAPSNEDLVLGQASILAEQPEFSTGESMRRLLALTDTREHLAEILRRGAPSRASA
jgi:heat-inducible transcriptional repressor